VLIVIVSSSAISRSFESRSAELSTGTRQERLPVVLRQAAERPFEGVGLASLSSRTGLRKRGTDSSFLQIYVQLGVIGSLGLLLLLMASIQAILPGLRYPTGLERTIAAAALSGMAVGVAAGASYGAFPPFRPYWLLAAIGVAVAERAPAQSNVRRRRSRARILIPAAGVGAGLVLLAVVPTKASVAAQFETIGVYREALTTAGSQGFFGTLLVNTACDVIMTTAANDPASVTRCYNMRTEANAQVGLGHVRIESPTLRQAQTRVRVTLAYAREWIPDLRVHLVEMKNHAVPTWARTAPLWGGVAGAWFAYVTPPMPVRRRRLAQPEAG
jgi:hypothetical protein